MLILRLLYILRTYFELKFLENIDLFSFIWISLIFHAFMKVANFRMLTHITPEKNEHIFDKYNRWNVMNVCLSCCLAAVVN